MASKTRNPASARDAAGLEHRLAADDTRVTIAPNPGPQVAIIDAAGLLVGEAQSSILADDAGLEYPVRHIIARTRFIGDTYIDIQNSSKAISGAGNG
jgi:hypothetical protein